MGEIKKFLDQTGVQHLWSKINMQDYPNNETLMAVIAAIDETKVDKNELIQPDWNQNDKTKTDYIKNRTHYTEISQHTILPLQTIVFDGENAHIPYLEGYEVGDSIVIEFDNNQYISVIEDGYHLGDNYYVAYFTTFDGIDIKIVIDGSWVYSTELTGEHIIAISIIEDIIIKQIEEKYIPDTIATKEYTQALFEKLNTDTKLGFYCIEEVTVIVNGSSRIFPANSNVEITLKDTDTFEIATTSDNSILSLTAFPGALGTYYSWLEGVKQFSNILFDMNNEEFYSKWSQGNQGMYQVQYAQYLNCIFWSDNPYISDVTKRTNYTLYNTSQLPLCYSSIPDNTFKAFYLALGVNSDPNWSNPAYTDSFAKATWATQVFSYYGARIVGLPEHSSITLPADCRGLMFYARNTEAAGTFDATNVTNFGAKSGSWREAFGYCSSLRRLYISNLKVSLNISWSPIDYESIYYIISEAANTSAITISVSPYTYNLLSQEDFDLATSKNITIALITTNYVEDKRLSEIANKADISYVDIRVPAWTTADEGAVLKIVNGTPTWVIEA